MNRFPPSEMGDANAVRRFMLAGSAKFTIVSKPTGTRFTYHVRKSAKASRDYFYVSVLVGPDNGADYAYLGFLAPRPGRVHEFSHGGTKALVGKDAPSAKAFAWFWERMRLAHRVPSTMEFHHEGRCGRCGRSLTVPESIETGLGPECATKTA